jgi:hypothetical protein
LHFVITSFFFYSPSRKNGKIFYREANLAKPKRITYGQTSYLTSLKNNYDPCLQRYICVQTVQLNGFCHSLRLSPHAIFLKRNNILLYFLFLEDLKQDVPIKLLLRRNHIFCSLCGGASADKAPPGCICYGMLSSLFLLFMSAVKA